MSLRVETQRHLHFRAVMPLVKTRLIDHNAVTHRMRKTGGKKHFLSLGPSGGKPISDQRAVVNQTQQPVRRTVPVDGEAHVEPKPSGVVGEPVTMHPVSDRGRELHIHAVAELHGISSGTGGFLAMREGDLDISLTDL